LSQSRRSRQLKKWIPLLGYAVSIGCLIFVYHGFDWKEQLPRIRQTPLPYILAAVLCDIAVYCIQGWRWNELLKPVGVLPVWRSMQAIYIGLFANEVLPLRPGEVIRSFLQARWSGVPFTIVLSSVIIERLFDGFWLIAGFLITSFFVELPSILVYGSRLLGAILFIVGSLLAFAVLSRERAATWINPKFRHHLDALEAMGRSRSFYRSFLISFAYLALQIGPIYLIEQGFGLDLGLGACAGILVILRLGSVPPQAPSNVGTFQGFAILGAMLFGVDRQSATGFATLLFIVITVPLWVVGFFALLATKMKLSHLTHDAHQ
jgi:uncharacterized protein (TIRG00374 family)